MSLPSSFQYVVSRLSPVVRNQVKMVAIGNSTVKPNQSLTFDLPSDSIIDLNTLCLRADYGYQYAQTATTAGSRNVPQPHTLIRSAQWSLNGSVVSGNNLQHFGQVYEMLRRCSGSIAHGRSNLDEYSEVPQPDSNGGFQGNRSGSLYSTATKRIHMDDFLGLQHGKNAGNFDSSLVGNIRLRLEFNGQEPVMDMSDDGSVGASANYDWQLQNCELVCDVITFTTPDNMYDNVISALLQEGQTLQMAYPEYYSQLSSESNNTKFNVSSQSLDFIGVAPLLSTYSSGTHMQSANTGLITTATNSKYGPNFTRFAMTSNGSAPYGADVTTPKYYWNINQRVYPQSGNENVCDSMVHTKNCFSKGLDSQNLLFEGNLQNDNAVSFKDFETAQGSRLNFNHSNCIIFHKLCLDAPAHQSENNAVSGINTQGQSSVISLQSTSWNSSSDFKLLVAGTSAIMEIGGGQNINITY